MPAHAGAGVAIVQLGNEGFEAYPLLMGKVVRAHHANTQGGLIEPGNMGANFIHMAAGDNRAVGIDDKVIADVREVRILELAPIGSPLESTILVPAINALRRRENARRARRTLEQAHAVGRGRAMNNNEVNGAHGGMMPRARAMLP